MVVYNVDEDRAGVQELDVPEHAHAAISLCAETEAEIAGKIRSRLLQLSSRKRD